ncbi:MAG: hypothetical protein HY902_18160 [Deltaproteobacteria bacterium]|nr:hypothetical protein [Deltaproteobacteria bacterium]
MANPPITNFAIEPDVPHDPLAAAAGPEWARARHMAVLGLPLDERTLSLLAALEQLDVVLQAAAEATKPMRVRHPTEELPAAAVEVTTAAAAAEADELPEDIADAIELSPDEVSDAFVVPPAPDEVESLAQTSKLPQFATADTIVLSGPEIKRKIRHKQSIMPSYVAQVLYEDIGALFEIGDREGALVSLERLLVVAPITPQIESFLEHNEARLVEYYESVLGPWTRTGRLREGETALPAAFHRFDKVAQLVRHLDGTLTLSEVIARSGLRNIEACSVLSQLSRSSSLDLSDKPT